MELGSEDEDTRLEDSPREQSTVPSSRSPSVLSSAHEEELEPVPTRSAQHRDVVMEFPTPARSPAEPTTNSPISYSLAVSQRQSRFRLPSNAPPKSYAIESVYSISTSTQVHALALPPCASHLYVGGADGLVRRYAIHPMLNCLRSDNLPSNNLTMKPGGSVPPAPDTKFPVLVAYWENEEPGTWQNTIRENVAFGTKNVGLADRVSVVHSLAVQSEELWGLSGTANGSINLYTIRHDEGQIRHVFPSSTNATMGHRPNSAVSVLTLIEDEKSVLSGGWDHSILEWDLNTGLARRQYEAHTGQISTLEFRPLTPPVPTSPSLSASSSTGVAASLVNNPTNGRASSPKSDEAFDPLFDSQDSDVDADGDEDDEPTATSSTLPPRPPARNVPILGRAEDLPELSSDVFLSSSIDGAIMIWDRRIEGDGKGGVRRLDSSKNGGWCSSACWSSSGQEIYVGRRSSTVEIYDIRNTSSTPSSFSPSLQSIKMPKLSGAVSCVKALSSGHHLLSGSYDNIRLWDLGRIEGGKDYETGMIGWRIVPGHHGGVISSMLIDPQGKFLFSASGNRGWEGTSTESVVVHEIKSFL